MDASTSTAQRLRIIRGKVSRIEFARLLDVHPNTLGRYERGQTEPDFTFARSICTKFGIEPRWLLFGTGPMRDSDATLAVGQHHSFQGLTASQFNGSSSFNEEIGELLTENRELRQENRELNRLLRRLVEENADLRVTLAKGRQAAG